MGIATEYIKSRYDSHHKERTGLVQQYIRNVQHTVGHIDSDVMFA